MIIAKKSQHNATNVACFSVNVQLTWWMSTRAVACELDVHMLPHQARASISRCFRDKLHRPVTWAADATVGMFKYTVAQPQESAQTVKNYSGKLIYLYVSLTRGLDLTAVHCCNHLEYATVFYLWHLVHWRNVPFKDESCFPTVSGRWQVSFERAVCYCHHCEQSTPCWYMKNQKKTLGHSL